MTTIKRSSNLKHLNLDQLFLSLGSEFGIKFGVNGFVFFVNFEVFISAIPYQLDSCQMHNVLGKKYAHHPLI